LAKLTIAQLDLAGRRVFVRADLNAPLEGGAVTRLLCRGARRRDGGQHEE